MTEDTPLGAQYSSAVRAYLDGAGEDALARAYEIGRQAMTQGLSVADVALIHHEALAALGDEVRESNEWSGLATMLVECLAPFVTRFGGIKGTEEALRASEERFSLLVEGTSDAIFMLDPEGRIITWNAGAEHIYRYRAEDILQQHVSQLYAPKDVEQQAPQESLRAAKATGRFEEETWGLRGDGSRFLANSVVTALADGLGNIRGFARITRDVTERREMEAAGAARDKAVEVARLKSEFLANMSHEIRTPLNAVIGMTGLLIDTDMNPEQRSYAETIRGSGEALLTIINDILDYSKFEAGKLDLEMIDFDVGAMVEDTAAGLAEPAYAKDLELAILIRPEVPTRVRGDPGRLRQILTNLIGNAVKFTSEGEVVVTVGVTDEGAEPGRLRFEVVDTGIGMAPDVQRRLFEPFSQADASTTRTHGGTGLGLAISKQLVELMGGEIGVRSEPGQGSTFWFTARLKRPAGAQPPRSVPPEVLVGLRVLVVDDNAANRTILEHQITSWQMQAGLAQDGPSALDMLRAAAASGEPYDVALLDMNMPGMDGCELARAIGADLALGATRLVLLTSVGVRGSADAARRAGMSAYLTKPVRQSQLYDTLAMVMGGEPSERVLETLVTRHSISEARVRARVLVAEDNPTNQKVASAMLRKIGYRADVVANGAEAADALARVGPAAVLMDCQMPEMDGYEATAKIREGEAESSRHTPIIAMTASAMESDRQRCFAAGMDDYVAKPVRLEELAAVLARWIPEGDATPGSQATRDPSTDESPDAVLDPKMLDPLQKLHIGEGEAGIYEFVDQLVEDASTNLGKLHDAIAEGDAAVVGRLSHTLRGTVGIAGAARMASMCAELEADASEGELTAASSMIHRIEREFARVRTALRERFPASRQRGPVAPSKR